MVQLEEQAYKCLRYPEDRYPACFHCCRPSMKQRCLWMKHRMVDPTTLLETAREVGKSDEAVRRTHMNEEEEKRWKYLKEHPSFLRGSRKEEEPKVKKEEPKAKKHKAPDSGGPLAKKPHVVPEEVTDLVDVKPLAVEGLKWCYQRRVFAHVSANMKYKVLFQETKGGYELVLCYKEDAQHFRTVVFDLAQHITALRYSERSPLSLLLWCITPLPPALMVKAQWDTFLDAMQGRMQSQHQEPEWGLALFFPAKEQHRLRNVVRLLREKCFADIQDTASLPPNQAARLLDATAEAAFLEATGVRLPRRRAFRVTTLQKDGPRVTWQLDAVPYTPPERPDSADSAEPSKPQELTQEAAAS